MNKARITYRFDHNGDVIPADDNRREEKRVIPLSKDEYRVVEPQEDKERTAEEEVRIFDSQPLNQFTTDFGAWSSPFDAEAERVEQEIRNSGQGVPEPQKDNRPAESADHDRYAGPYGPVIVDEPIRSGPRSRSRYSDHHRGPSWLRMLLSLAGAVGTGILFGWFVLSLFTDSSPIPSLQETAVDPSGELSPETAVPIVPEDGTNTNPAPEAVRTPGILNVSLASRTFYLLQHGVFSTPERAETAMGTLREQGFAAAGSKDEQYHVFAGIFADKMEAEALKLQMELQGLETFVKTFDIPAVDGIRWNGADPAQERKQVERFVAMGHGIVEDVISFTAGHGFGGLSGQSVATAEVGEIVEKHKTWIDAFSSVNQGMKEEWKPMLQRMNSALNTAVASLQEYMKNPSDAYLGQSQAAMVRYVLLEKEWLLAVSEERTAARQQN